MADKTHERPESRESWRIVWTKAALVAVLYLLLARLGLAIRVMPEGIAALWPPSGMLLAALLLSRRPAWMPILLSVAVANVASNMIGGRALIQSAGYAFASTFEAYLGALLMVRYSGARFSFRTVREIVGFLIFGCLTSYLVGSTLGATTTIAFVPGSSFVAALLTWATSGGVGVLLVTPLIIAWAVPTDRRLERRQLVEMVLLLVALFGVSATVFGPLSDISLTYPLPFLTFPLVIWAAMRFGLRGASTSVALVFVIAITNVLAGHPILEDRDPAHSIQWLQVYLAILSLSSLIIAAVFEEQRRTRAELDRREAELQHAQKLESVGRLAGGIAHDFNNLLTSIYGHLQMATDELPEEHPAQEHLRIIHLAAKRGADLTNQLLGFAKKQVIQPEILDMNRIVEDARSLLARMMGEDIEIISSLDPDLPRVRADRGQLTQVLVNLGVNARDAMPDGGTLRIETTRETVAGSLPGDVPEIAPGEYVVVTVEDTGEGLSEEVRRHLFEPFFTTKPPGKGTGLGLATCFGILRQNGGHISARSRSGRGATFVIHYPATEERPGISDPHPESQPRSGAETILLVEDETPLLDLCRTVLESKGYRILTAENGAIALEKVRAHDGEIHLLVTDVVMPNVGGAALANTLKATHAGLRVLFMSGHTEHPALGKGFRTGDARFLAKPFTPDQLVAAVRKAMDSFEAPIVD